MIRLIVSLSVSLLFLTVTWALPFSADKLAPLPAHERYTLKTAGGLQITVVAAYLPTKKEWQVTEDNTYADTRSVENYVIRLDDMQVVSCVSKRYFPQGSYTETYRLGNQNISNSSAEDFLVASIRQGMACYARMMTFSDVKTVNIKTFGGKRNQFGITMRNNGVRRIDTPKYGNVEAIEIEIGYNMGVFSGMIPKTYYYFKNDFSRTPLRLSGSFFPGEEQKVYDLADYLTNDIKTDK